MPSTRQLMNALPTKPYGPFQVAGVRFMQRTNGRCVLGDSMGLGKTYQTIAYLKLNPDAFPAVICCPASLKYNWQREFWRHAHLKADVLEGFKPFGIRLRLWKEERGLGDSYITERWFATKEKLQAWQSSHIHRIKVFGNIVERSFPKLGRLNILNYDILDEWLPALLSLDPVTAVWDEFQKLKSLKAQRTKAALIFTETRERIIGLSGTPILSRPAEFFPMLHMIDPVEYPSLYNFGFRYCSPKRGFKGHWEFKGASNLAELHEKLKSIMLRRLKKDVLADLPQTQRTVIPVGISNAEEYEEAENDFVDWLIANKGIKAASKSMKAEKLVQLGELKRLAGRGKLSAVLEWIKDWHESTGQKLVTFAVHKAITKALSDALPHSVMIRGDTGIVDRQKAVDAFQNNPKVMDFVGNIQAAGEGITLTASPAVAFAELGWTPADHSQAAARISRIGQGAAHLDAFYFIARGTVEERVWDIIENKIDVVGQVLDGDGAEHVQTKIMDELIRSREERKAG